MNDLTKTLILADAEGHDEMAGMMEENVEYTDELTLALISAHKKAAKELRKLVENARK